MSQNGLTVLVPSNRNLPDSLPAISRALSVTEHGLRLIVSDNSGDEKKADFLRNLADEYGFILSTPIGETSAVENFSNCLKLANTDYCICLADDDDLEPDSIVKIYDHIITGGNNDPVGYTGDYIVANRQQRYFHRYRDISTSSQIGRTINFLKSGPTNFLFYSVWKKNLLEDAIGLRNVLPFDFPYRDWIFCFNMLLHGGVQKLNVPFYKYNTLNWLSGGADRIHSDAVRKFGLSAAHVNILSLMNGLEGYWLASQRERFPKSKNLEISLAGLYWMKWWAFIYFKRQKNPRSFYSLDACVDQFLRADLKSSSALAYALCAEILETLESESSHRLSEYFDFFRFRHI